MMSQENAVRLPPVRRRLITLFACAAFAAGAAQAVAADAPPSSTGYNQHCLVCHGQDLAGVPNLGVGLTDSAFVSNRSMDELVEFLKVGRLPNDPDSVAGMAMPGFAWMSEDELIEIARFIREPR
ncbi:MAG: cytochrome c [Chromatiales bacterium]|nr:cytochrome c [Chromatiales bacterium]